MKLSDIELLERVVPFLFGDKKMREHWNARRHLTEILGKNGRLLGRCAIQTEHLNAAAVGVTKGIFAGYINGLTGIVISTSQADLARDIAFPEMTKRELKVWADEHAEMLANLGHIDEETSAWLAAFGAEHQRLIMGKLGTQEISYTAFCNYLKGIDTLLVYDEEVSYEDDDPVDFYQLEEFFTPNQNLLIFQAEDWTWSSPEWIEKLPQDGIDDSLWSMQSALVAAIKSTWGKEDCWHRNHKSVAIGTVGKFSIMRVCDVYSRGALSA